MRTDKAAVRTVDSVQRTEALRRWFSQHGREDRGMEIHGGWDEDESKVEITIAYALV